MAFLSKTPKGNKTPTRRSVAVRSVKSQAGNVPGMTPMHTPPKKAKGSFKAPK